MNINIEESWKNILQSEFEKESFINLFEFVKSEYENHHCYPEDKKIFAAFNTCAFKDLKVVIIGQDPYHGKGQANGLCFAVLDGIPHPPSLKNIFKELHTDVGKSIPVSGNLSSWAKQGVLLLNTSLTVKAHVSNSHSSQWKDITDSMISYLSDSFTNLIFMLWGGNAFKKKEYIDGNKHQVLISSHPSPLGCSKQMKGHTSFNDSNHFVECNDILTLHLEQERINF